MYLRASSLVLLNVVVCFFSLTLNINVLHLISRLTLYGRNFFCHFSGHNLIQALSVYRLIGATLIGIFLTIPYFKIEILAIQVKFVLSGHKWLRGSATQNCLIFPFCFFMLKMKLYVCRNLCENFRQIGQKMKKL